MFHTAENLMNLLLLSNSTSEAGYLAHALPDITALVQDQGAALPAIFVPFAGVTRDWDTYTRMVNDALTPIDVVLESLHQSLDPVTAVEQARLIVVGGGNTFNLLRELRHRRLLSSITRRVTDGHAAYLGWSAGANLACPSIRTSNDMPIVDPQGLDALGLIDYQINPHYTNAHPAGHRGETRDQRLAEYCARNPEVPVIGLPEGSGLHISAAGTTLIGPHDAKVLQGSKLPRVVAPGKIEVNA